MVPQPKEPLNSLCAGQALAGAAAGQARSVFGEASSVPLSVENQELFRSSSLPVIVAKQLQVSTAVSGETPSLERLLLFHVSRPLWYFYDGHLFCLIPTKKSSNPEDLKSGLVL
jgi:hypothetical protein